MTEGHGDDAYRYAGRIIHNFSSNIYSAVDHSGLAAHLASHPRLLTEYPEPEPLTLAARIAEMIGIAPGEVLVSSGATEAIYLAAMLHRAGRSAVVVPTFREYQDACTLHSHDLRFITSLAAMPADTDTLWLCNPNNPTGKVTGRDELIDCIDAHPSTLFVIDQAYEDYCTKPLLTPREAAGRANLLLLHSLTKRFAIPGLRIGYAIGCVGLIDSLRTLRQPWTVNALAIEAAAYLIERSDDYRINAPNLHSETLRIAAGLRGLGIEVADTDCNFILCRLPRGNAAELKDYLVSEHGILIRDASNFETLDGRYFRVAAQSPAQNDLLIHAIEKWIIS